MHLMIGIENATIALLIFRWKDYNCFLDNWFRAGYAFPIHNLTREVAFCLLIIEIENIILKKEYNFPLDLEKIMFSLLIVGLAKTVFALLILRLEILYLPVLLWA